MITDPLVSDELWREKILRDTLAVVGDPLLVCDDEVLEFQQGIDSRVRRFLDLHASRLEYLIPPPGARLPLGKWYEQVFFVALRVAFPDWEVRHSVSDGRGGELDFVVSNNREIIHIECAVKFFLLVGDSARLSSYVGAGGNDRLDLKLSKMINVQLARGLPEFGEGSRVRKYAWMGGRVHDYYRGAPHCRIDRRESPLNPYARRDFWAYLDEMESMISELGGHWTPLPRRWWITDLNGIESTMLRAFSRDRAIEDGSDSILLVNWECVEGRCVELRRIMFVRRGFDSSPKTS